MRVVIDFRAGATHHGFAVLVEDGVQEGPDGTFVNVSVSKDGRTFILRRPSTPSGEGWNVQVVSVEYPPEAGNEHARILACDTTANGVGKALVAFKKGGVLIFPAYKRRGPSLIKRWDGTKFEEVLGRSTARALGWLPPDDKEIEQIL
jgi:hypothetical protein